MYFAPQTAKPGYGPDANSFGNSDLA